MSDPLTALESGLTRLLGRMGSEHPSYTEALTLQSRLLENISATRIYGDTETRRAERAQIMHTLNRLARETVQVTFNRLCGPYPPIPYLVHRFLLPADYSSNFAHQAELTEWLARDAIPLIVVVGPSGVGKSALVWDWASGIAEGREIPTEGLFGWSFAENPDFTTFIGEAVIYASSGEVVPDGSQSTMDLCKVLLHYLEERPILLVLDGFEHALMAYGDLLSQTDVIANRQSLAAADLRRCAHPAASYLLQRTCSVRGIKAKILIASRLFPCELEGQEGHPLSGSQVLRLGGEFEWFCGHSDLPLKREILATVKTFCDLDPWAINAVLSIGEFNSYIAVLAIWTLHRLARSILDDEKLRRFLPQWFLPPVPHPVAAALTRTLIHIADLLDGRNVSLSVLEDLFRLIDWPNLRLSNVRSLLTLLFMAVFAAIEWETSLIDTLGQLRVEEASEFLACQLKHRRSSVREKAALALCYASQTLESIWCLIERLRTDPKAKVRAACAEALGYSASPAPVGALIESLNDPDQLVRYRATYSLGWIGDDQAYNALIDKSQEWSDEIWVRASRERVEMSAVAREAAEQIKQRSLKRQSSRRSPPSLAPNTWVRYTIAGAGII